MAKYKTINNMPYNVTARTTHHWNTFIDQTLAGNGLAAINAYHAFTKAREDAFEREQGIEITF